MKIAPNNHAGWKTSATVAPTFQSACPPNANRSPQHHAGSKTGATGGFTMVEIALSLAIIAFGLVAIIGVLPSGMTVQRDNRWSTIINEDGQFWMNAIRNGTRDSLVGLPGHVTAMQTVTRPVTAIPPDIYPAGSYPQTPSTIIGLLSRPGLINRAEVRAISGSAAELDPASMSLSYLLFSIIEPFPDAPPELAENLWEVRLVFRWPAYPNGEVGNSRKVFRTLVRGQLVETNGLFFFHENLATTVSLN